MTKNVEFKRHNETVYLKKEEEEEENGNEIGREREGEITLH